MNPSKKITALPKIIPSTVSIPSLPTLPGVSGVLSTLIVAAKQQVRTFIKDNLKEGTTNVDEVNTYADKLEANLLAQGINAQGKAATMTELVFTAPPTGGIVVVTPVTV